MLNLQATRGYHRHKVVEKLLGTVISTTLSASIANQRLQKSVFILEIPLQRKSFLVSAVACEYIWVTRVSVSSHKMGHTPTQYCTDPLIT